MTKVGILMGSDSDLPVMQKAAQMLEKFGIGYEMTIISAHRMPDVFVDYATKAEERGIEITPILIDQLKGSMIRAQAKGATNILAMDTEKAFIINVPNAKVITAITQDEMKDSVFTNIDGAVFL